MYLTQHWITAYRRHRTTLLNTGFFAATTISVHNFCGCCYRYSSFYMGLATCVKLVYCHASEIAEYFVPAPLRSLLINAIGNA